MGFWDVLDLTEEEDKWFTAKELKAKLQTSYNSINRHLRKLVHLGYVIFEEHVKYVKNYQIPYKRYKAAKHLRKDGKKE